MRNGRFDLGDEKGVTISDLKCGINFVCLTKGIGDRVTLK